VYRWLVPAANRSGQLSPTTAEHVLRDLDGRIDAVLDGGPTRAGIESTVVDLSSVEPRLLRPGPIRPTDLEALLGPIAHRPFAVTDVSGSNRIATGALPSPGLLDKHYAPQTPLLWLLTMGRRRLGPRGRVGLVTQLDTILPGVTVERLPADADGYAAGLYAALHRLDRLGLTHIIVASLPDGEEWLAAARPPTASGFLNWPPYRINLSCRYNFCNSAARTRGSVHGIHFRPS
jgi:L-threonylcarbamoyladenylate synthase